MSLEYLRNLKSDIRLRHPTFPRYPTFKTVGINMSPREGGRFPNSQSTYHTTMAVFLYQSTATIHWRFPSARSSIPTTYWFSCLRVLGRHHTGAPNLKDVSSFCVLWQVRSGASNCLWRNFVHHRCQPLSSVLCKSSLVISKNQIQNEAITYGKHILRAPSN